MRSRLRGVLGSLGLLAATAIAVTSATPAHADTVICDKFGSTSIQGGRYIVQNNEWGSDLPQCITATNTGFAITQANHDVPTNGAPAAYPSVYYGCHYANCSTGSILPLQATDPRFAGIRTSVDMSFPGSGQWDAAYDIWFDPTARTDGQNTGAEIMVWVNHAGAPQPVGSRVATVSLAGGTWDVWEGNIGWNVVSYVRTPGASSVDFFPATFFNDAVSRGYAQPAWYLTSIQAGFEPWTGGQGLAVNTFTVTTGNGGGGGDTQPPSTPTGLSASGVTSSSANLSWQPSTDNTGVAGYDVFRGTTQVGTASGTSFTASGLSAATTYSFSVRARDAAGNTSANSSPVTVTTASQGGDGTGACSVTYTKNDWGSGFTADVKVTNTGTAALSGWTVGWSFSGNQQITNGWNATITQNGTTISARNMSYNGSLAPGASTTFGFQATYSGGNPVPGTFTCS